MAYEPQAKLMGEIAALFTEYREGGEALVKFGMKCGLALNRLPIAGGIMMTPKKNDAKFQISDPAFREKYPTEKDAFSAAFDAFAGHGQFLAWNGKKPRDGAFDHVKELSENFAHPTMTVEMIYRRRGQEHEEKLSMFFIGFASEDEAKSYAARHAAQVQ